jgi:DNA-binding response OmpR family regulator
MKIVIVDDEIILSNKIAKKLEHHGFSVVIYNSYKKFIQRSPGMVDLYVIDLSLRDGSGIDIITFLRKNNIQSPIMIIS